MLAKCLHLFFLSEIPDSLLYRLYDEMSYNNRMSQQFRGTQQQQQHRGRKKEDENDAMMRLVRPLAPIAC